MKNLLLIGVCAIGLCQIARADYEEVRELSLDARAIQTLQIEAGAGSLDIIGVTSIDTLDVTALIRVPGADTDKARAIIADDLVLSLEDRGSDAELKSWFERGFRFFGQSPAIDLEVRLPEGMSLVVEDGSGSINIRNVLGDIVLDDGSGSIEMTDVGGVVSITDGSGSISVRGAGGDVSIIDGSGSITLELIEGSVRIEDGSGSITVAGVAGDVIIPRAGSGSVTVTDVDGRIERGD